MEMMQAIKFEWKWYGFAMRGFLLLLSLQHDLFDPQVNMENIW